MLSRQEHNKLQQELCATIESLDSLDLEIKDTRDTCGKYQAAAAKGKINPEDAKNLSEYFANVIGRTYNVANIEVNKRNYFINRAEFFTKFVIDYFGKTIAEFSAPFYEEENRKLTNEREYPVRLHEAIKSGKFKNVRVDEVIKKDLITNSGDYTTVKLGSATYRYTQNPLLSRVRKSLINRMLLCYLLQYITYTVKNIYITRAKQAGFERNIWVFDYAAHHISRELRTKDYLIALDALRSAELDIQEICKTFDGISNTKVSSDLNIKKTIELLDEQVAVRFGEECHYIDYEKCNFAGVYKRYIGFALAQVAQEALLQGDYHKESVQSDLFVTIKNQMTLLQPKELKRLRRIKEARATYNQIIKLQEEIKEFILNSFPEDTKRALKGRFVGKLAPTSLTFQMGEKFSIQAEFDGQIISNTKTFKYKNVKSLFVVAFIQAYVKALNGLVTDEQLLRVKQKTLQQFGTGNLIEYRPPAAKQTNTNIDI